MKICSGRQLAIAATIAPLMWAAVNTGPILVAQAEGPVSVTTRVDATSCATWLGILRSSDPKIPAAAARVFARATVNDCAITWIDSAIRPTGLDADAGGCRTYYETSTYTALGIPWLWDHVNGDACFDYSSHAWLYNGTYPMWIHCDVSALVSFFGTDWCGVPFNNSNQMQIGSDFHVARYETPWNTHYGGDRWHVDPWGNVSHVLQYLN